MNYKEQSTRIEYMEYIVQKGDSLYMIAEKHNTTVSELTDINMLTSNTIFPGQVLLIPKNSNQVVDYYFENYLVQPNDTVKKIADSLGVDPVLIGLYNDFAGYQIVPGQTLKIPRNNIYVVKQNDTLDSILKTTNKTPEQLLRANATNWLKTGNKIYL